MNPLQVLLFLFGFWNLVDGVASVLWFRKQRWVFHVGRVVRVIVGIGIVLIALWRL